MYCENCGTKLSDDAKFCRNCGSKVRDIPLPDCEDADISIPAVFVEEKPSMKEDYTTVSLFEMPIKISNAVARYYKMKKQAYIQAEQIQQEAKVYYYDHKDDITSFESKCDLLIETGDAAQKKMQEYCYNLLFELGIYDYSLNSFLSVPGLASVSSGRYYSFIDKQKEKLDKLDQAAMSKYAEREVRKAARGRFVGGGFGISGAIGGAVQAGLMNAATGLAYSAVNAVGNVATAISTGNNKEQLKKQFLQDDSFASDFYMELWKSLKSVVDGAFERYEYIAYEQIHSVPKECEEKAVILLGNIRAGRIPEDKRKKYLAEGLNENPTYKEFFVYILCNFPEEYESLCKITDILDIKMEEVMECYLSNAESLWEGERFEVFVTYDRKENISIADVEEYKKKLEDNCKYVEEALQELNLPDGVITEAFIKKYVRAASGCYVVDDQYRNMEYIGMDETFNFFTGPDYVEAKDYDEFITYLQDREKILELGNDFNTTELQAFVRYDWEDVEYSSGIEVITAVQNRLRSMAEEIEETCPGKEYTKYLIAELKEIAVAMEPLITDLKEKKKEYELEEERKKTHCQNCGSKLIEGAKFCGECGTPVASAASTEVAVKVTPAERKTRFEELCKWIFEDVEYQYGDRVTVFGISPAYHDVESMGKAFGCNLNVEKPLIAFDYSMCFDEGFLITDKKFYSKDKHKGDIVIRNDEIGDVLSGKELLANALYIVQKEGRVSAPVYLSGMENTIDMVYRLHLLYSMAKETEGADKNLFSDRKTLISDIICFSPPVDSSMLIRGKIYVPSGNAKLQKMKKNFGVSDEEKIFMILDSSMFGSCKVGLAISMRGIILKDGSNSNTVWLDWERFKTATVKKGVTSIKVNASDFSCNVGAEQETAYSILRNLQTVVRLYPDLFKEDR